MSSGINLLGHKEQTPISPFANRMRLLRGIAVAFLFIVSVSSMILSILIAVSPLPQLQKQEEASLATMGQFHPDIAKLALVNDRANNISQLLASRSNFDQIIELVKNQMPQGIAITSLTMSKNAIALTVSSASLNQLDVFMNNLVRVSQGQKNFSKVTMTDLSIDEEKNLYLLTINIGVL